MGEYITGLGLEIRQISNDLVFLEELAEVGKSSLHARYIPLNKDGDEIKYDINKLSWRFPEIIELYPTGVPLPYLSAWILDDEKINLLKEEIKKALCNQEDEIYDLRMELSGNYSISQKDYPELLDWINENLPDGVYFESPEELKDEKTVEATGNLLLEDDESRIDSLAYTALMILTHAVKNNLPEIKASDSAGVLDAQISDLEDKELLEDIGDRIIKDRMSWEEYEAAVDKAVDEYDRDNHQKALKLLNKLAYEKVYYGPYHYYLGYIHYELEEHRNVIAEMQEVLRGNYTELHTDALKTIANSYHWLKDFDLAKKYYQWYLQEAKEPEPGVMAELGELYLQTGDIKNAQVYIEKAYQLDAEDDFIAEQYEALKKTLK